MKQYKNTGKIPDQLEHQISEFTDGSFVLFFINDEGEVDRHISVQRGADLCALMRGMELFCENDKAIQAVDSFEENFEDFPDLNGDLEGEID